MHLPRALVATLLFLSAGLAGCSSGSSGNGFTVKAPSTPGGAYEFTADASADNYTWDLGDHLTTASGKSVTHTYDFTNGVITVTLKATKAGVATEYNQVVTLGTGVDQKATFLMEAQTDWAVTGETVSFSAARSHDPEGDPLRLSWSCLRTGPAERKPAHTHPVFGVPFASPPAGSVTTGKANHTLPPADQTFSGDLCDALGAGTKASTHMATIAGVFTNTGVYSIYLLASDGPHPTTSGEFKLYVTPPGDRPAPTVSAHGEGTLNGGSQGDLNNVCSQAPPTGQSCDVGVVTFELPLGGTFLQLNFSVSPTAPYPVGAPATWSLMRGPSNVDSGTESKEITDAAKLTAGTYTVTVTLAAGVAQAKYSLDIFARVDLDPAKVY